MSGDPWPAGWPIYAPNYITAPPRQHVPIMAPVPEPGSKTVIEVDRLGNYTVMQVPAD